MPSHHTVEDVATYLLGPVMGVVLRLRGVICLHASGVVVDGQAIALVGVSGAGKSTSAAAFARLGYSVLTDDVLALTVCVDHFLVCPAYPRIRLWPNSVTGLFASADVLPRMTPGWDKRFLNLNAPGYHFQIEPLPLAAIYFLGPRTQGMSLPQVDAINPAEALMAFVSDSYATNFLDKPRRAKEFEVLSRLVKSVPMRRVAASDDFARIDEFCNLIVRDFRTKRSTAIDLVH